MSKLVVFVDSKSSVRSVTLLLDEVEVVTEGCVMFALVGVFCGDVD